MNTNQRTFFMTLAAGGSVLSTAAHSQAKADEKDPKSVALGYVADAAKTDTKRTLNTLPVKFVSTAPCIKSKPVMPRVVAHWLLASKLRAKVGAVHGPKNQSVAESPAVPLSGAGQTQSVNLSPLLLTPGDKLPAWVLADLRTDHAGEVGAVCIYQGVLQYVRDPVLRAFAEHHLATEQKHLRLISGWLPPAHYSRLLPLWRLAGFLTGALPALFGPKAVYATIEAVETFVNRHYEEQILALASQAELNDLRQTLLDCQADEVAHRDEAAALEPAQPGWVLRAWCAMVGTGSKAAVALIRHI
jgi:ubiquinone biosynthesis monooxygenase Coq7